MSHKSTIILAIMIARLRLMQSDKYRQIMPKNYGLWSPGTGTSLREIRTLIGKESVGSVLLSNRSCKCGPIRSQLTPARPGYKSWRRKWFLHLFRRLNQCLTVSWSVHIPNRFCPPKNMWFAVLILLALPLVALVYFELKASRHRQKFKEFNGPTPVAVLGNANRIGKTPAGQFPKEPTS